MELLPVRHAASGVDPDPQNESKTVSPAKLNSLIKRSAKPQGNGAGCPFCRLAPRMSCQYGRCQASISSFCSIERAFCNMEVERYAPGFRSITTCSKSFLMMAPG